jgi:RNA polymerase sigma factor (sigma-70 family)
MTVPVAMRTLDVAELYRRHRGLVWRRVRSFYDAEECEEVVQEVFARVTEVASSWRGECHPVTWLYQVATRHCLNRVRDERRRRELLDLHGDPVWSSPITPADQETRTYLAQFWRDLDEELALVAILYFRDGLTHDAIAEAIGTSRRTVGNRLAHLTELARRSAEPQPQEPT